MAEYTIIHPSVDVVGTEFRELLRSATGTMEMHGRITAYEKNARIAFDITGTGIHVHTVYTLTAVPHGTQLDGEADIQIGGRLSWLVDALVRRRLVRQFNNELAQLRGLAEQHPADDMNRPRSVGRASTGARPLHSARLAREGGRDGR